MNLLLVFTMTIELSNLTSKNSWSCPFPAQTHLWLFTNQSLPEESPSLCCALRLLPWSPNQVNLRCCFDSFRQRLSVSREHDAITVTKRITNANFAKFLIFPESFRDLVLISCYVLWAPMSTPVNFNLEFHLDLSEESEII